METLMAVFAIVISVMVLYKIFKGRKLGSLFISPHDEDFKEFSDDWYEYSEADFSLLREILSNNIVLSSEPSLARLDIINIVDAVANTCGSPRFRSCGVKMGNKSFVLTFFDDQIKVTHSGEHEVAAYDILHAFRIMRLTGLGHWFTSIITVVETPPVEKV